MKTRLTARHRTAVAALIGTVCLAAAATTASATTVPDEPVTTEAMTDSSVAMDDTATSMAAMSDFEMPTGMSGDIVISGSSTVEPISSAAATAFAEANPDVAISVNGPGTGDGFARFCNGETDISDASRPIKDEELANCEANGIEFVEIKVAVDGLSVITSAQNDAVECLSFVDLWALLGPDATGISNWADASAIADTAAETVTDLGAVHTPYPDAELTVTAPGEESGTYDSFVEIVIDAVGGELGVEDAAPRLDYTASPNDNVIVEGIAANPTSLGWVGFAFVEENLDTIKPLQVDGGSGCVEPTPETIASGEYPIARDLFIYVNTAKADANPGLTAFVDYYVNAGMTALVGTGEGQIPYVALNEADAAASLERWNSRTTGSNIAGEIGTTGDTTVDAGATDTTTA